MLALMLPIGLAALAALALPALIHLARRSEEQLTDFAALRWLSQKPKPRQRLRFDEWPLLLLRLLLLALLALWLARPVLRDEADATPWVVVAPGLDAEVPPDAEVRWLAPGFPPTDTPTPASAPIASLLRQLDAELPADAPLTVVVPERLSGLDGARIQLSRRIDWQVRSGAMPAPKAGAPAVPALAVRYAPDQAAGVRYLRAAATAWRQPGRALAFEAAPIGTALPSRDRVLVWLAAGALPTNVQAWVKQGGTALVAASTAIDAPDSAKGAMVEEWPLGRGRLLRFNQPLAAATMPQLLEPSFPHELRELLAAAPPQPSTARAIDVAPIAGGRGYPQPARELQPWLALLIGTLFLAERWMATRRTRRVAP